MSPGDLVMATYHMRLFRHHDYTAIEKITADHREPFVHMMSPGQLALVVAAVEWHDDVRLLLLCNERLGWRSRGQFKGVITP